MIGPLKYFLTPNNHVAIITTRIRPRFGPAKFIFAQLTGYTRGTGRKMMRKRHTHIATMLMGTPNFPRCHGPCSNPRLIRR